MILAKKAILKKWKSVPVFAIWLRDPSYMLPLEELKYKILDRQKIFVKIWNPIKSIINNLDLELLNVLVVKIRGAFDILHVNFSTRN